MSILKPDIVLYDRYRIVHLIGQGGFGAVYEAIDQRLSRRVALKQLLRVSERISRQFAREAQLLANLHHPALPRVTDHFNDPSGQFLVMDYVAGDDLAALLLNRDAAFPVAQVQTWAIQLLDVLHYLHTRQPPIIHRDLKPQNLKLQPDGAIMLLDFGLAKGFAGDVSPPTTESSFLAYTKGYAPPEQIENLGTDARSDLYSLSATVYCLVTNYAPIEAQTRLLAAARGRPDPLKPAHVLNPDVPEALSQVLTQALALEPDDRPPSAQAMRAMLLAPDGSAVMTPVPPVVLPTRPVSQPATQSRPATHEPEPTVIDEPTVPRTIVDRTVPTPEPSEPRTIVDRTVPTPEPSEPRTIVDRTVPTPQPSLPPRPVVDQSPPMLPLPLHTVDEPRTPTPSVPVVKPARRRPIWLGLSIGGVLLVGLAAVMIFLVMSGNLTLPGITPVATEVAVQPDAAPTPEPEIEPTPEVEPTPETEPTPEIEPTPEPSDAPSEEEPPSEEDQIQQQVQQHLEAAIAAFGERGGLDQAIEEGNAALELDADNADAHALLALLYMQRFQWDDVYREASSAIDTNPSHAAAYSFLSQAVREQGDYDRALASADKAIEIDGELSLGYTARALVQLQGANANYDQNLLAEALASAEKAIELSGDEDSYNQVEAYAAKASVLSSRYSFTNDQNDLQQAIEEYRQAIGGNVQLSWHYVNLGNTLATAGRYEDAETAFAAAIDRDPNLYSSYEGRGWMLYQQQQYDAAIEQFSTAIDLSKNTPIATTFRGRGLAHQYNAFVEGKDKQAELRAAREDLERATDIDPNQPWYWSDLGAALQDSGAPFVSSTFEKAIELFKQELERNSNNAGAYEGIGWAQRRLQHLDEALETFNNAIGANSKQSGAYLGKAYVQYEQQLKDDACGTLTEGLNELPGNQQLEQGKRDLECQ